MQTITTTYQEIPSYGEGRKKCCDCRKTISKRFKEYQTINPWNNKTASEIRQENINKLNIAIAKWESATENCSACRKLGIPDLDIDFITKEEWDLTQDLRDEISQLRKTLSERENLLGSQFEGRHINVIYNKQERIGQVNMVWNVRNFSYDIVRADLK